MSITDTDVSYAAGTLEDVAGELYDELLTTGSSVLLSDLVKILITNAKKYAGWSDQLHPMPADQDAATKPLLVVEATTVLSVGDWLIIEPVVRAHCDLVQARRMEGAQNLGVQPSGMSSSEALQLYKDAIITMQKESFQYQPFSIELPDDSRQKSYPIWLWDL
jgi:hypothetical protein